jgi:hypothetical protein
MLWWFVILGVSSVLVVSVAVSLYMRVRQQMKNASALNPESNKSDQRPSPPES